ncbi:MAG: TIGR02186 family protein [Pseudomonadota bacterium]
MIRWVSLCLFLLLWPAQAAAEEKIIALLSQNQISITTNFDGSELDISGAVERYAPPPEGPLDVIVIIIGPSEPVIVRKKERQFGIWINDAGVKVDRAPSFYAISTTRPLEDIISHTEDFRHKVGLEYSVRLIGETTDVAYPEEYRLAAIRLNEARGLYFEQTGGVTLKNDTLFQTNVRLPAQLVEGDYRARILLLRDLQVIDQHEQTIAVRKVGLERLIYTMATEQPAIYGVISIAVALAAGWLASAFFRFFLP